MLLIGTNVNVKRSRNREGGETRAAEAEATPRPFASALRYPKKSRRLWCPATRSLSYGLPVELDDESGVELLVPVLLLLPLLGE